MCPKGFAIPVRMIWAGGLIQMVVSPHEVKLLLPRLPFLLPLSW